MKAHVIVLTFLLSPLFYGCSEDRIEENPYLGEPRFSITLDLNLPLYSPLLDDGTAIYVGGEGVGIKGIFVINTGFNEYYAFEASCPNHVPNDCSTMELDGGINVKCNCEDHEYSLYTGDILNGDEEGLYSLLWYSAVYTGGSVRVSN